MSIGLIIGLVAVLFLILYQSKDEVTVVNSVMPESQQMLQVIVTDRVALGKCIEDRMVVNGIVFNAKVSEVHYRFVDESMNKDEIAICYGNDYPVVK